MSIKDSLEKNFIENKEPFVLVKKKTIVKPKSFAKAVLGIKHKNFDDVVRVKVGEEEIRERKTKLECCLVGRCIGGSSMQYTKTLKRRMWSAWELKGSLNVIVLDKEMWLIEFNRKKEAERILRAQEIWGTFLSLEKWSEEVGCMTSKEEAAEAWIRIIGLLVHLWSRLILRKIGDGCGGFLVVDEDTTFMANLRWARIRVMWDGKSYPQFVEVSVGPKRYEIQLWWEIHLFLSSINILREKSTSPRLEVEDGRDTCARRSVSSEEKGVEKTDGTRLVSSSGVRQTYLKSQEKVDLRSGQASEANRGSSSACGLDTGSG